MNRRMVSSILSLTYCGLGQLYNRQIAKGIDFIIVYTILIASFFSPVPLLRLIGLSILPFMWVAGMVDAYLGADIVFHKKEWFLGILPGIFLSILVFYIQYTHFPGNPNVINSGSQLENSGAFSVQAASFQDLKEARSLYNELSNKGYSVRIERSFSTAGRLCRVLIGSFDTAGDAALLANKLREETEFPNAVVYDNAAKKEKIEKPDTDEQPD